jgi:simple sugar transport system permease protein
LQASFNPGYGFTGIAVALAARLNPIAVIPAAFFFGGLSTAGDYLQLNTNAPSQFIDVVTALVILLMTGRVIERILLSPRLRKRLRRSTSPEDAAPEGGP